MIFVIMFDCLDSFQWLLDILLVFINFKRKMQDGKEY